MKIEQSALSTQKNQACTHFCTGMLLCYTESYRNRERKSGKRAIRFIHIHLKWNAWHFALHCIVFSLNSFSVRPLRMFHLNKVSRKSVGWIWSWCWNERVPIKIPNYILRQQKKKKTNTVKWIHIQYSFRRCSLVALARTLQTPHFHKHGNARCDKWTEDFNLSWDLFFRKCAHILNAIAFRELQFMYMFMSVMRELLLARVSLRCKSKLNIHYQYNLRHHFGHLFSSSSVRIHYEIMNRNLAWSIDSKWTISLGPCWKR